MKVTAMTISLGKHMTTESLTWEWYEDPEEIIPDYENAARIEFNVSVEDERVQRAASDLVVDIECNKANNLMHMAVVLLNLYRCYRFDPEKWVVYVRRKGNYEIVFKYNRNRIAWTSLVRIIDELIGRDFVDHVPGFYYRKQEVGQGKCSRVRAKPDLIELLEDEYGFTWDVYQKRPDEEVIILKDEDKKPVDYEDNSRNEAARKRTFVRKYNAFLQKTYLDIDAEGFQPNHDLNIDLSRRKIYRVFNNNSFTQGGRVYGGFWEEIPSALRLRIIINNLKVVEFDYSGVHISLLYAKEGIDFSVQNRDAYTLEGYPETPKMRKLFKDLLLAALNASPKKDKRGRLMSGEERARSALQQKINKKPDDYPNKEQRPDLKDAIADFSEYHEPIKHKFYTGVGLKLMYMDSQIVEDVLKAMMLKDIPVLTVHDSFVCPKLHKHELYQAMKDSYQKHCKFDISKVIGTPGRRVLYPGIKIKEDERDRKIEYPIASDIEYHYDLTTITDEVLLKQILLYDEEQIVENDIYIKIYSDGTVTRRLPSREEEQPS
jgi:hypothetical protein